MSEQPLSARAYANAVRMHQSDSRMARPKIEDFTHLDTPPAIAPDRQAVVETPPAVVAPGWDMSAFGALPADIRAGIQAGTAHGLGRGMLELEAERELVRPADVHLHLTDPGRYVDASGKVDREAIRADVQRLTVERPELSKYGHGPGQEPHRPDERRHAAPGAVVGAGPGPVSTNTVEATRARMEAASGVRFAATGEETR